MTVFNDFSLTKCLSYLNISFRSANYFISVYGTQLILPPRQPLLRHWPLQGNPLVKRGRDDIFRIQLLLRNHCCNSMCGCNLHVLGNVFCPHSKDTLEEPREYQHIVDLVRIVRAACANDRRTTCLGSSGMISGTGFAWQIQYRYSWLLPSLL